MPNKPLPFHPSIGAVLKCDYSNLVAPEMSKIRDIVVVSPKFLNRPNLCTVVPLSTTSPIKIEPYHVQLDRDPNPRGIEEEIVWAKCDMVMTVSFARLSAPWVEKIDGKRNYLSLSVSQKELGDIRRGVLYALGLSHLWKGSL
jgi:mRNA interferase MazF